MGLCSFIFNMCIIGRKVFFELVSSRLEMEEEGISEFEVRLIEII